MGLTPPARRYAYDVDDLDDELSRTRRILQWFLRREPILATDWQWPSPSGSQPLVLQVGWRTWGARMRRFILDPTNLVALVLVLAYVLWFSVLSLRSYDAYTAPPFDLAIFDQGLWLLTHLHVPFVTVMGRNLFGDHTSFVLLLLAPIYRLVPEPQGILVIQSVLLGVGGLPIYVFAKRRTASASLATMALGVYLLNPMLQQGNLDQFHPEAFLVLFASLALFGVLEGRSALFVVAALLALSVKEDAAMIVVPLAIFFALRRDRRVGFIVGLVAVAYAFVANLLIIPSILGYASIYAGRLPFNGVTGILGTLVHRPGELVSYLLSASRPFYVWQLVSTVGLAFLASPGVALIGLGVLAENLISNDVYMHQILYQYSMVFAPVLAMGVAYAIQRQRRRRRQVLLASVALTAALWSCSVWGFAPFSANHVYVLPPSEVAAMNYVAAGLPPHAIVSADWPFVAHIDHRVQVYVWPTPFEAENWGSFAQTGQTLPQAFDVRYLLLTQPLGSTDAPNVLTSLRSQFRVVRQDGNYVLYERRK